MKLKRLIKILLITNFSLIGLSAGILNLAKTDGYEISIYSAVSSYFWYFLVFGIFISICIIIHQAFSGDTDTKHWWVLGISTIMLSNMVILLLPVFRGYEIYGRWDISTHVGYVKDILQFNHISNNIIYPAIHILIAIISRITNTNEIQIINYIIPLFLELYILFMYCLAKTVFINRKEIIISTLASSVLFLSYINYQVLPNTLSILLLPIVFYTYLNVFKSNVECKNTKSLFQFRIILVIFIIFFPFFHPLTSFILIVTFLVTYLLMFHYNKKFNLSLNGKRRQNTIVPALIGFIVFVLWISTKLSFWNNNIHQVTTWFIGEATTPVVSKNISTIFEKLHMKLLDIIELFIKIYGHIFIYIVFSIIAAAIVIRGIFWKRDKSLHYLYFLIGWFSVYNLFLIIHIFSTILKFGFWRIVAIVIVTTPIFVGYVISKSMDNKKYYQFVCITVIIILFFSSIIGIFNTFPSPYTLQTNQQVTKSEIVGMKWYYFNKNISYNDMNIKSCYRFADFILGDKKRHERSDILNCEREDTKIGRSLSIGLVPKHFSYTNFSRFSDYINRDKRLENVSYMPIFKYERIYYADMYPQLDEFNENDFKKLNFDTSLYRIYDNDGIDIWKIVN